MWVFFTRHVFFPISFIVSFSRYFSLQITILNSPMSFMHLAKVAQNWHNIMRHNHAEVKQNNKAIVADGIAQIRQSSK